MGFDFFDTHTHTLHTLTHISLFDVCRRMKMRIQMRLGGMGEKESEKRFISYRSPIAMNSIFHVCCNRKIIGHSSKNEPAMKPNILCSLNFSPKLWKKPQMQKGNAQLLQKFTESIRSCTLCVL